MTTASPPRIGGLVLNRDRGCLEDAEGSERFLRPKSYRLLEVLLDRRGVLMSKDDLVREVWPDVFVSDDSLAHCVSDIRRALGAEGAARLRTVPCRGYILLPEGVVQRPAAGLMRGRAGFLRAGGLVAAAWTLAVGLWCALPQGASGPGLLAADSALPAELLAASLLDDRDWRERGKNEDARALLEEVLAENPENADAWANLGLTYWLEVRHLSWGGGRREMAQALEIVERAFGIGGSARPHRLLAEIRLLAPFPEMRSAVDALANAQIAVAMDPADADNLAVLAQVFALTGRAPEAVGMIEKARQLEPAAPDWYREVAGLSYLLAGEPAQAAEEFGPLHGAGTFVGERWWPGWLLAASLAHAGRLDDASAIIRAAEGRRPPQNVASVAQSMPGLADPESLDLVLGGLRLAGVPS